MRHSQEEGELRNATWGAYPKIRASDYRVVPRSEYLGGACFTPLAPASAASPPRERWERPAGLEAMGSFRTRSATSSTVIGAQSHLAHDAQIPAHQRHARCCSTPGAHSVCSAHHSGCCCCCNGCARVLQVMEPPSESLLRHTAASKGWDNAAQRSLLASQQLSAAPFVSSGSALQGSDGTFAPTKFLQDPARDTAPPPRIPPHLTAHHTADALQDVKREMAVVRAFSAPGGAGGSRRASPQTERPRAAPPWGMKEWSDAASQLRGGSAALAFAPKAADRL